MFLLSLTKHGTAIAEFIPDGLVLLIARIAAAGVFWRSADEDRRLPHQGFDVLPIPGGIHAAGDPAGFRSISCDRVGGCILRAFATRYLSPRSPARRHCSR